MPSIPCFCRVAGSGRPVWLAAVISFFAAEIDPLRAQSAVVRIMPLGDSLTRGTNDINAPNGDIPGGYRRRLATLLDGAAVAYDFVGERTDNAAPGLDPDHNGNNGFRTDQVLSGLPGWMAAAPDVVLLMAGTNDVLQRVPVAVAAANLENLVIQITSTRPGCRVLVATIPPIQMDWPRFGASVPAAVLDADATAFNAAVRAVVARHAAAGRPVNLVDMSAGIVLDDPDPALDFYQPGDGIHPGQAGYDQLGGLWFAGLQQAGELLAPETMGSPVAPSGLAAAVVSPSRVNLQWLDQAENEAVYQVWSREHPAGVWRVEATLPAGSVGRAITGLRTGAVSYSFAVAAVNAAGSSAWSNIAATPAPLELAHQRPASASSSFNTSSQPQHAVDGQKTTRWASGSGTLGAAHWQVDLGGHYHVQRVLLTMRQDADVAAHRRLFEVRVSGDPGFASHVVLGGQGADPLPHKAVFDLAVSGAAAGRYLRVAKTEVQSHALALVEVYGAVPPPLPAAPLQPAGEALGDRHVLIRWSSGSGNESHFRVERDAGLGQGFAVVATLAAPAEEWIDGTGLLPATAYHYRIVAVNEAGASASSPVVSVTTAPISAYEQWSAAYPGFAGLAASERIPDADANGDGVSNLLAYACGADPMTAGRPVCGLAAGSGTGLEFRFRRNRQAADVEHEVLFSEDLEGHDWVPVDLASARVLAVPGEPGVEEVVLPVLHAAGDSDGFLRLRVVKQP